MLGFHLIKSTDNIGTIFKPMLIVGTKNMLYITNINNIFRRKLGNATKSMLNLLRYTYFDGEDINNVLYLRAGGLLEKSFRPRGLLIYLRAYKLFLYIDNADLLIVFGTPTWKKNYVSLR